MKQIRLLIVDDHAIIRKGISMYLDTEPTIKIVGEAVDGRDGIRMTERLQPDVILMDLVMPVMDGIEAISYLKQHLPSPKIIVLTTFGDQDKFKAAMAAGADGFLLKDSDGKALVQAIKAVQQGEMPLHPSVTSYLVKSIDPKNKSDRDQLTRREREVLRLLTRGWSNQEVAQELGISRGTVKVYVSHILQKLSASSRTEAALMAMNEGLFASDPS